MVRQTKKSVLAERRRPMIAEREKDCSFLKVYKGDESVRSVGRLCTENKRVTEIVARYIRVPPPPQVKMKTCKLINNKTFQKMKTLNQKMNLELLTCKIAIGSGEKRTWKGQRGLLLARCSFFLSRRGLHLYSTGRGRAVTRPCLLSQGWRAQIRRTRHIG